MITVQQRSQQVLSILRKRVSKFAEWLRSPQTLSSETLPPPQQLRDTLVELGPTFIKMGQVLSTRKDIIKGESYISALATLQDDVKPIDDEVVKSIIETEAHYWADPALEADGQERGTLTDLTFLAAGSIGQTYSATRLLAEGEAQRVVVKVQRPDIEPLIKADIEFARQTVLRVAPILRKSLRRTVREFVEQFASTILLELDFTREAEHTRVIGGTLSGRYPLRVVTPTVYEEFTSPRMMVLSFIDGFRLSDVFKSADALNLTADEKRDIASTITNIFLKQVFIDGFFHADPQAGNFKVLRNPDTGEVEVGLFDFGMVGRLDERSRNLLVDFLIAVVRHDAASATDKLLDYGTHGAGINRQSLEREVERLLKEFASKNFGEASLGNLIQDIFNLLMEFDIAIPVNFLMVARVFVSIEGIGANLVDGYSLADVAEPFFEERLKENMLSFDRREFVLSMLQDFGRLGRAPRNIERILTQLQQGQLRVAVDLDGHPSLQVAIGKALGLSLLASAALVSAALLLREPAPTQLLGYPPLGLVLLAFSACLSVWLFTTIARIDR
jgi:ubiquinone biosynthesis protein